MHGATPSPQPAVRQVEIGAERAGQRLDNYLTTTLKGLPRSLIYRLLRTGQVRVNGGRAKPDRRLAEGDVVRIPPVRTAEREPTAAPPRQQLDRIEASVIFEDAHFLVIDKPSGIASHGGSGISHGAIELLRAARPREHLELAHRLDRDTSGVLVLTRSRAALTGVQALIREGRTLKQYLALLDGRPARARFDVNAPLRKFVLQGGERMVRVSDDGKPALTFFKRIDAWREATLVEATLGSGRTHQIRVHAAHAGHAVAGDDKYGTREANRRFHAAGLDRLFLHASRFEFDWNGRAYCFSAPLPQGLKIVLDALPR
ncbi:MAG TPA: RluA family pseudouridine synthase [Rhodanobacteraceae bacterium]|nr:RluA family pseudouridine synthase [Rhodanobacteraceae bacterium]